MPIKMSAVQSWVICAYPRVFLGLPQSSCADGRCWGCTWLCWAAGHLLDPAAIRQGFGAYRGRTGADQEPDMGVMHVVPIFRLHRFVEHRECH
jgi:hypothetical protein